MKKRLSRKQIRRFLIEEIQNIGEDALVKKLDNTLGGTIRKGHIKYHDCSSCGASMNMCDCGYLDEDKCSECDAVVQEASCKSKDYPAGSMKKLDSIDYSQPMSSLDSASHHDDFATPGEAVGIGYNIGKSHKSGAYMSKSQLYKISKYAEKLYTLIPEGHDLEDWMRTKISQIADDIGEVYHALDHDSFEGDI